MAASSSIKHSLLRQATVRENLGHGEDAKDLRLASALIEDLVYDKRVLAEKIKRLERKNETDD